MLRLTGTVWIAALLALISAATTAAFAPSSSFVGRQRITSVVPAISTTALQMNLFDRFQRVAKANLNNILQNLEDPEKIMGQALEDMQVRRLIGWIGLGAAMG
jgi:Skp family chaperone for outer membrane proteins